MKQGCAWPGQDGNSIPLLEEEKEEMGISEETNDEHRNGGVSEELLLS